MPFGNRQFSVEIKSSRVDLERATNIGARFRFEQKSCHFSAMDAVETSHRGIRAICTPDGGADCGDVVMPGWWNPSLARAGSFVLIMVCYSRHEGWTIPARRRSDTLKGFSHGILTQVVEIGSAGRFTVSCEAWTPVYSRDLVSCELVPSRVACEEQPACHPITSLAQTPSLYQPVHSLRGQVWMSLDTGLFVLFLA